MLCLGGEQGAISGGPNLLPAQVRASLLVIRLPRETKILSCVQFFLKTLKKKYLKAALFFLSLSVLVSRSLGHFSISPCSRVITDSFKVTFVHYLRLVVKSATADQAFMGFNVSYRHFGN